MKRITLSFDNGPDALTTPAVLDVLNEYHIQASFFIVGNQLERPGALDIVRRAKNEGHWIGNHTYSHSPALGEQNGEDLPLREIQRTQLLLVDTAHRPLLFRPSGTKGALDKRLFTQPCVDFLLKNDYTCVLWDCVPGDLQGLDWVERAFERASTQEWTVLVVHDIPGGVLPRLREFLDRAVAEGYEFVQEFPAHCLPIFEGKLTRPIDAYVAD